MNKCYKSCIIFAVLIFLCCIVMCSKAGQEESPSAERDLTPDIFIHYLGHASFIIQLDNGVSILTDYGESRSYGLDSPIYGFGDFVPDIVTYSHRDHVDHAGGKVPENVAHVLTNLDSLSLNGVRIRPIRTSEKSLEETDNTSYLISYKGFHILHLGDAQANISNIQQEDNKNRITKILPKHVDLLLMTIQGVDPLIRQSEAFIDLLQPKRVIPMHYWSKEYKASFLNYLYIQNKKPKKNYHVEELGGAKYDVSSAAKKVEGIHVLSLEPAAFAKE